MDGLPGRKHFLWLVGVAALGLTAQWALPPLQGGRLEDPTVVFLVGAGGVLGTAAFWTAQDVMRRWRVWQRRRMTPWQRRAKDDGGAVGFQVLVTTPTERVEQGPRAARRADAIPASRRRILLAAIVVIWTAVALLSVAFVEDVLVPFVRR